MKQYENFQQDVHAKTAGSPCQDINSSRDEDLGHEASESSLVAYVATEKKTNAGGKAPKQNKRPQRIFPNQKKMQRYYNHSFIHRYCITDAYVDFTLHRLGIRGGQYLWRRLLLTWIICC